MNVRHSEIEVGDSCEIRGSQREYCKNEWLWLLENQSDEVREMGTLDSPNPSFLTVSFIPDSNLQSATTPSEGITGDRILGKQVHGTPAPLQSDRTIFLARALR
jgi:hypothetical protein